MKLVAGHRGVLEVPANEPETVKPHGRRRDRKRRASRSLSVWAEGGGWGLATDRESASWEAVTRRPCRGAAETNLTGIHEDTGLIPGLNQWVKDLVLL